MKRSPSLLLALSLVVGTTGAALAQQGGTLKKIQDSGSITMGHRDAASPFSFYDDKQQVVGYAMDLCYKIADAVKKELKLQRAQGVAVFEVIGNSRADYAGIKVRSVIKEIDKDPNSPGFGKPLREYTYAGKQVIRLVTYHYLGNQLQVVTADVVYKADGSVDQFHESTRYEEEKKTGA